MIHCLVGGIQSDMLRQVWYEGGGAQPHHDLPHPRQELLGSYHHSPLWLPHAAQVRWMGGRRPIRRLLVGPGLHGGPSHRMVCQEWLRPNTPKL